MTQDAIEYYHSLLNGALADDAQARLDSGTQRYDLKFSTRPICTVLRPFLITTVQYEEVMRGSRLVLSAIRKLGRVLMADSNLRAQMDLTADEEQLIAIDPGFAAPDASGRLDAFLDSQGGFHFVEYNAESPGGLLYGDVLSEIFMEMEIVRRFGQLYPLRRIPIRPRILETLLACYREWGGQVHPQIAIVDWREVGTRAEFEICREYFERRGYRAIIVDPDELEYREGSLFVGPFRIHLVYKRVVSGELLDRGGINHPLIRAARDRVVCVVNSFRVQMLFRKALFALLDDPVNEHLFDREEVAGLRGHIPWTRRFREGFATYEGRRIDLVEFVASNRERLVLKPNSDYGGRGVTLGWECDDERWREALKNALGASFVVQERVELLKQSFPSMSDGEIRFTERYVDFDPYTWRGEEVAGAGVRLSSSALLNVSAGGGSAAPVLIVAGKI